MTHDELVLNAALCRVNKIITRYISRVLDIDQEQSQYTRPLSEVQRELADELGEVQELLRDVMGISAAAPDPVSD